MNDKKPALSVVIPTLGRPILIQTLESLVAAQGFDKCEVWVVGKIADSGVEQRLRALMDAHSQVQHLQVSFEKGDSSEKKNAGFRASRSELVAFLDDDVVVSPDWPLRIVEPFSDPAVGLVSGPSLVPDEIPLMARLAGHALASKAAGYVAERYLAGGQEPRRVKWSRLIGCNMVYRRPVLEQVGLFDPKFWPGEEMIAAFRATAPGHVLVFCPSAYVYHYPRQSLARFAKQTFGYGATRIRLMRAGVEIEPATLVPMVWVLSLLVLGAGAIFSRWMAWLLWLDLGLYLLATAWIVVSKLMQTRKASDLLLFVVIPLMHISYGIAEWVELFHPDRDLSEKAV